VTKPLGFKALALVASMGLCAALVSGCNPEEPAKPITPAPTPSVSKPLPPKTDVKTPAFPVTPPKTEGEKERIEKSK
jgi:hypothetical protein